MFVHILLRKWLFFALVFCVSALNNPEVWADQLIQKPGFSISIPDGWVEIPSDVMAVYVQRLSMNTPKSAERFQYGFQEKHGEWFTFPYILLANNESGRLSERRLSTMDQIDMSKVARDQVQANELILDMQIGQLLYDREANIVWARAEAEIPIFGRVTTMLASVPTERGMLRAGGTALAVEFPAYEQKFKRSLGTLKADPSIEYQWRVHPGTQGTQTMSQAILSLGTLVIILLGIVGLVVFVTRQWITS